ncbi:MAG: hypothetical protein ACI4AH_00755 [Muribaculaceae bacterium]
MKILRIFLVMVGISLSMSVMAQNALTDDAAKAQKALMEYLRSKSISPSIDTRDNSVCFKSEGVFYWVTFEESAPVLYTIHRKGVKFEEDPAFKPSCARIACNEVNRKHKIKCSYNDKRVEFVMQTYAKEPSDFHGGFGKMMAAFKGVDETFKNTYDKAFDKWKKDSIANNTPITPEVTDGASPLIVTYICFGNFDAKGNVISDYDKAIRKSQCQFIKASLDVESEEKGIFKIAMKLFNPEGKAMVATKGFEYSATSNIEIKKTGKPIQCELGSYGSSDKDFWKAGEYKVEIYDYEKGALLYTTSFTIL